MLEISTEDGCPDGYRPVLTLSLSLVEEFSVLGEVPVRCDSKYVSQNGPEERCS